MTGPCVCCGKPGAWVVDLSWLCEPCADHALMDPTEEKRRDDEEPRLLERETRRLER